MRGEFAGRSLVEDASLWSQQNDRARRLRSKNGFDCFENRFRLHNHPAAAAVGRVIGGVMTVVCVIADVVQAHVDQAALAGAFQDAGVQIGRKNLGEERENFELHRLDSSI